MIAADNGMSDSKRCRCHLVLLAVMVAALSGVFAQRSTGPKILNLSLSAKSANTRSAWDGSIDIFLAIESGYHINSNSPTSEFLIPTSVKFKLNPLVEFGPLEYPKGVTKKLGFSEEKVSIYEGKVTITAPFKAAPRASSGQVTIQGVFAYQACTDQACLPPRAEDFEILVTLPKR
jgi:hypothetical protein